MPDQTSSTPAAVNNVIPTKANPSSLRFESNMRALAELVAQVRNEEEKIREGGCEGYIAKPISVVNFLQTVASFLAATPA